MSFTPYHFGPSGFFGLLFRKWIDLPVFVLANVVVDVEVIVIEFFGLGWPVHRYCHTLLVSAVVGAFWGIAAYPLRHLFKGIMEIFYVPYKTSLRKMIVSGILGVWLHVLIDGLYHSDVRIFWPCKTMLLLQTIRDHINRGQIETICMLFFVAAFVVYVLSVMIFRSRRIRDNE